MMNKVAPTYHVKKSIPYMKWVALRFLGCILIYSSSYILALDNTCYGVGFGPPSDNFLFIIVWPLKFLLDKFYLGGLNNESSNLPNTFFIESVIFRIEIKYL